MTPLSAGEAWRWARARGIGVHAAETLRILATVEIIWTPPLKISDGPLALDNPGHRYSFRLHQSPDGWWVEGTDGFGPWVPCEGPIVDSGRPPWLARPKEIGDQK